MPTVCTNAFDQTVHVGFGVQINRHRLDPAMLGKFGGCRLELCLVAGDQNHIGSALEQSSGGFLTHPARSADDHRNWRIVLVHSCSNVREKPTR